MRSTDQRLVFGLVAFLCFFGRDAVIAAETRPTRLPSEKELNRALDEVRTFYSDELAKLKGNDDKIALATTLLADAKKTRNDPSGQYALYRLAEELSSTAGDLDLTIDNSSSIAESFAIPASVAKASALQRFAATSERTPRSVRIRLAEESIELVDPLLDEQELELALECAKVAETMSKRAREFLLYRAAHQEVVELESLAKQWEVLSKADVDRLDAAGSTKVGSFMCLVFSDWTAGLKLLKNGDDKKLALLSSQSLIAQTTEEKLAVADEWWDLAEKLEGRQQRSARDFASTYYKRVSPDLDGLAARRASTRSEETGIRRFDAVVAPGQQGVAVQERLRRSRNSRVPEFTFYGRIRVSEAEIKVFLEQCRDAKTKRLQMLRDSVNRSTGLFSPDEIVQRQQVFQYVNRPDVIIVPRKLLSAAGIGSAGIGGIFKPERLRSTESGAQIAYCNLIVRQIIDANSVLCTSESYSSDRFLIEGLNTSSLKLGDWQCHLLLKRVNDRQISGVIGTRPIQVYQAVSREGFPPDVLLW